MASTNTSKASRKTTRSTSSATPTRKLLAPKIKGSIPLATLRKAVEAVKAARSAIEAT